MELESCSFSKAALGIACHSHICQSHILNVSPFFSVIKEEMYNTINSYYNYTSWKSSFNIINILILPIDTGKNYLKYSNILPLFVTTSHYESNFLYCEIKKFHDAM